MTKIIALFTLVASVSLYAQEYKTRKTPAIKDHVYYISWLATKKRTLWLLQEEVGPEEDMASVLFTSLYACREKLGLGDKDWISIHPELTPCMREMGFKLLEAKKE